MPRRRAERRATGRQWMLSFHLECLCGQSRAVAAHTPLAGGNRTDLVVCPACLQEYRLAGWDDGPILLVIDRVGDKAVRSPSEELPDGKSTPASGRRRG